MTFIGIPNTSGSFFNLHSISKQREVGEKELGAAEGFFFFFFFFFFFKLPGILKKKKHLFECLDSSPNHFFYFFLDWRNSTQKFKNFIIIIIKITFLNLLLITAVISIVFSS